MMDCADFILHVCPSMCYFVRDMGFFDRGGAQIYTFRFNMIDLYTNLLGTSFGIKNFTSHRMNNITLSN
jgi:hypothetical protein